MPVRSARTTAHALLLLGALLALSLARRGGVRAADGLAFPAAAGSTWHIVAGYNTATHTGGDPYAIDVVRDDAETAGTAVLSPVEGNIGYVADDCLSVTDARDVRILLCHIFPIEGLQRGDPVARGDRIATVAPPGMANNNGLAHIHIAASPAGRGSITIPLAAAYAIEGVQLAPTSAPNAYMGTRFRSSNVATTIPIVHATTPATSGILSGFTPAGRSLVVVVEATMTDRILTAMAEAGALPAACTLSTISAGSWVTYIPAAPAPVNASWLEHYGTGVPARTALFTRCG